jgi:hypothetical protein
MHDRGDYKSGWELERVGTVSQRYAEGHLCRLCCAFAALSCWQQTVLLLCACRGMHCRPHAC